MHPTWGKRQILHVEEARDIPGLASDDHKRALPLSCVRRGRCQQSGDSTKLLSQYRPPMDLPKQFDNITSHVIDDLKQVLRSGSRVSVAAASFSIYAFEALRKELEQVEEFRFIFTALSDINYFGNRYRSVIVLLYKKFYDKLSTNKSNYCSNFLTQDSLYPNVLFLSVLSQDQGMSNGTSVPYIKMRNIKIQPKI